MQIWRLEQLREIGIEPSCALLEPTGRNTAPALTLAALAAIQDGEDPILIVTPADQSITDQGEFANAMQTAVVQAAADNIVILGITPDRAETGYGYIQTEKSSTIPAVFKVKRFVEKPDAINAQRYVDEGSYFWNAGIFVVKASIWLKVLGPFRSDILNRTTVAWLKRTTDTRFSRPNKMEFEAIPAESIDYAVMERCGTSALSLKMVSLNAGWSDLGSWDAVWRNSVKDSDGHAHRGNVVAIGSHNTLAYSNGRLIALLGVENLAVIESADAILVSSLSRCQDIKRILDTLSLNSKERS
jgi:mannose-1-phosphate guanylyltransferase / mannose-6-phosphate isomerase